MTSRVSRQMVLQDLGKPVYSGRPYVIRVRFADDFIIHTEMCQEIEAFLHEVIRDGMPYFLSSCICGGWMSGTRRLYPSRPHLSLQEFQGRQKPYIHSCQ
jgi:hypothetical protein